MAEYIAGRTALNRGEIENVLRELNEAIVFFAKRGTPVKLEGVGTFTPNIDLGGAINLALRLNGDIAGPLNTPGAFTGEIVNPEHIGKTSAMLKEMWNAANPGNPIP